LNDAQLRHPCAAEIAMIFQDPMTSLHPVYRARWQISEQIQAHEDVEGRRARALDRPPAPGGHPVAESRVDNYPHEFSGGHAPAGDDRDGAGQLRRGSSSPTSRPPRST
jgi:ABC-type microcin C transport system duplicated ATPase subunit YejF